MLDAYRSDCTSKAVTRRAAIAACAVMYIGLTGCSNGSRDDSTSTATLRVGVRDDIVGFGFLNEDTGKYYGLEIDIANEMAHRMGYGKVEFTTVNPDNRKELLLEGAVDCLVACYSISDTRLENFDFSPAYYRDRAIVMVENSSLFDDIAQLKDGTIGILKGSNTGPQLAIKLNELGIIGDDIVSKDEMGVQYDGVYVKDYPSYAELSRALEAGEVDAAAMDGSLAQTFLDSERSVLDINIANQEYGVATQKGSELSGDVATTVQEMIDDGTIDALVNKWN